MVIIIVETEVTLLELKSIASRQFGDMVKFVVDIEKGIMAIAGDLHADEEALLIANGSFQENLWGVNFYPEKKGDARIEFDSLINIRPSQDNRSRYVEDQGIRDRIMEIIDRLVN